MAGQKTPESDASPADNAEFKAMLEGIQAEQAKLNKRVEDTEAKAKTLEESNEKLKEQIAQKDEVIDGLNDKVVQMTETNHSSEARKKQEALALRDERAQRLSKGSGGMKAVHAITENVEVGKGKKKK